MNREEILSMVDHTLLSTTATQEEILQICDDGMKYHTASVCIPPVYVKCAASYVNGKLPICTVIGFPNGYSTTEVKYFEARKAVEDGADEIDMVIQLGWLRDRKYAELTEEIRRVKEACAGKILKVIIETCVLTEEEKIKMCEIVSAGGADFIKTSTGFSKGGATVEDVALFQKYVDKNVSIKAAGGISSFADAEAMIAAGAKRLGTSRLVKLIKEEQTEGKR